MREHFLNKTWGKFAPRRQKERKEESEFGPGRPDFVMCPQCEAVYYEKSWHHLLEQYEHFREDKRLKFELCPACRMIKNKRFEGLVVLLNIPLAKKDEVRRRIKNVEKEAFDNDVLDRVIAIKDLGNQLEIQTTENQLAIKIGKKVKKAFGGRLKIRKSHQEDFIKVVLEM